MSNEVVGRREDVIAPLRRKDGVGAVQFCSSLEGATGVPPTRESPSTTNSFFGVDESIAKTVILASMLSGASILSNAAAGSDPAAIGVSGEALDANTELGALVFCVPGGALLGGVPALLVDLLTRGKGRTSSSDVHLSSSQSNETPVMCTALQISTPTASPLPALSVATSAATGRAGGRSALSRLSRPSCCCSGCE